MPARRSADDHVASREVDAHPSLFLGGYQERGGLRRGQGHRRGQAVGIPPSVGDSQTLEGDGQIRVGAAGRQAEDRRVDAVESTEGLLHEDGTGDVDPHALAPGDRPRGADPVGDRPLRLGAGHRLGDEDRRREEDDEGAGEQGEEERRPRPDRLGLVDRARGRQHGGLLIEEGHAPRLIRSAR